MKKNFFKGKKVLVTGAGGFIGSHLTEELVRLGANVRAFVRYNSQGSWGWLEYSPPELKKEIEIVSGDIRDLHGVKHAMEGQEIVFHLAALIAIPFSYHSPDSYVETNINGTLNVLQAAREHEVSKIVHTSTSEVYGTAKFVPISEEHPLQAQSPYSATKIGADQIAMSFFNSFGTPVAIIRPFNTYGPRQSARAIIPTVISQIAAGKRVINIGAAHPTRDFNFIRDTVSGFLSVAESQKSVGQVINIGSNFEVSIGKTVEIIIELMGKNVRVETEKKRLRPEKSEVERLWADNSKARSLLCWEPAFGGIDGFKRGLSETIAWFVDPKNLGLYKVNLYNV